MLSSSAVFAANAAVSFSNLFIETVGLKSFMALSQNDAATRTQFTDKPTILYLRRERKDRHRIANVFDEAGIKIYTIERRTMFTPVWSMYTIDERREVATLHAGLMHRYFDLHCKPDIKHRDISLSFGASGLRRLFYLNDGAGYEWNTNSRFLERIVNPGCGDEEIRQRVARARQMRTMRFDFEILIDESLIDREVAIVTSYIAMLTQWGIGDCVDTRGPTVVYNTFQPLSAQSDRKDTVGVELKISDHDDSSFEDDLDFSSRPGPFRLLLESGSGTEQTSAGPAKLHHVTMQEQHLENEA